MKKIRKALAILLMVAAVCVLFVGCGPKKFEVSYCGAASVFGSYFIEGVYDGETYRLPVDCFQDGTVTDMSFEDAAGMKMLGTSDGKIRFSTAMVLTVQDAGGAAHTVHVGEGDAFEAVKDGSSLKLILPRE